LAAATVERMGYVDVAVLVGGINRWASEGYETEWGMNVPSKEFGERVEVEQHVPTVDARELRERIRGGEEVVILDTRTPEEYRRFCIPGGRSLPGGELAYRVGEVVRERPNATVVVNCAGRTRSIVGTRILQRMGLPNVVSLKNGTAGWVLAGEVLEAGADRDALPEPSPEERARVEAFARRIAAEDGVALISVDELRGLMARVAEETVYLVDVRTEREFATGHIPGFSWFPGGQAVQRADDLVAVRSGHVVFCDDGVARAAITGSWYRQMGFPNVSIVDGGTAAWRAAGLELKGGMAELEPFGLAEARAAIRAISPAELRGLLATPAPPSIIFVGTSAEFAGRPRARRVAGAARLLERADRSWCRLDRADRRHGRRSASVDAARGERTLRPSNRLPQKTWSRWSAARAGQAGGAVAGRRAGVERGVDEPRTSVVSGRVGAQLQSRHDSEYWRWSRGARAKYALAARRDMPSRTSLTGHPVAVRRPASMDELPPVLRADGLWAGARLRARVRRRYFAIVVSARPRAACALGTRRVDAEGELRAGLPARGQYVEAHASRACSAVIGARRWARRTSRWGLREFWRRRSSGNLLRFGQRSDRHALEDAYDARYEELGRPGARDQRSRNLQHSARRLADAGAVVTRPWRRARARSSIWSSCIAGRASASPPRPTTRPLLVSSGAAAGIAVAVAACDRRGRTRPGSRLRRRRESRRGDVHRAQTATATITRRGDGRDVGRDRHGAPRPQRGARRGDRPRTACVLYFAGAPITRPARCRWRPSSDCPRARRAGLVDAAGQIPPVANCGTSRASLGADVAIFSGGKGLRAAASGPRARRAASSRGADANATQSQPRPADEGRQGGDPRDRGAVEWSLARTSRSAGRLRGMSTVARRAARHRRRTADAATRARRPAPRPGDPRLAAPCPLSRDELGGGLWERIAAHRRRVGRRRPIALNPQTLEAGEDELVLDALRSLLVHQPCRSARANGPVSIHLTRF
jgi:rhodanese-related sulfurtransferase